MGDLYGCADENDSLNAACRNGQLEEVKRLLTDKNVDPTADDDAAIKYACVNGNVQIIKLLLADPRVNPSAEDDAAIGFASENGQVGAAKLLLADPRVDPSDGAFGAPIMLACNGGHVEMVKLLLADPRVDPSAASAMAFGKLPFENVCNNGNAEIAQLLLADPRLKPSLDVLKNALQVADERSHVAVVDLLVNSQPQLMISMCRGQVECVVDGPLRQELTRWEGRSAFLLLLCVKRCQTDRTAARVSDVMREVIDVFARFHV